MVGGENLQLGIQHHQRLAHGSYNVLGVFPGILDFGLQPFAFGDVLHGQQDNVRADIFPENLPGVEHNDLAADIDKIMLDFIAIEHGILGGSPR